MIDATDLKAHSTASSLNKGGMSSKLHGICHSKGGPLRLHLPEGQRSDFTGADGVLKDCRLRPQWLEIKGQNPQDAGPAEHPAPPLPQETSP